MMVADLNLFLSDRDALLEELGERHSDGVYSRESAESQEQQAYVSLALYELDTLLSQPKVIKTP